MKKSDTLPESDQLVTRIVKAFEGVSNIHRLAMAIALQEAGSKGVGMRELAIAGGDPVDGYSSYVKAHDMQPGPPKRALVHSAGGAFKKFFDTLKRVVEHSEPRALPAFRLEEPVDFRSNPSARVRIWAVADAEAAGAELGLGLQSHTLVYPKEAVGGLPVSPFQLWAPKGCTLTIVTNRAPSRWRFPDLPSGQTLAQYCAETNSDGNFLIGDTATRRLFQARNDTTNDTGVVLAEETNLTRLFDGHLWGVHRAALPHDDKVARFLYLEVLRLRYSQHRFFTGGQNLIKVGGEKKSKLVSASHWIREKHAKSASKELIAVHHVLKLCVLAVLEDRDKAQHVILSRRHNVAHGNECSEDFWSTTAAGHVSSERMRDNEGRGPDLRIQVQRQLKRQVGVDFGESTLRWSGVSARRNSVTIYATVRLTATPAEILDVFARRADRQLVRRIAIIPSGHVEAVMAELATFTQQSVAPDWRPNNAKDEWPDPLIRSLLGKKDSCSMVHDDLRTALALWLISERKAGLKPR